MPDSVLHSQKFKLSFFSQLSSFADKELRYGVREGLCSNFSRSVKDFWEITWCNRLCQNQENEARAVKWYSQSQTFVGTAGLILKSPSYSSALSIILALTTVLWFVMGLNTLSCQIFVLGPIGDVGICSYQLHHLCCVGDLLGQWTCVQSSEYQHHCTIRGKQVGEKNNNNS